MFAAAPPLVGLLIRFWLIGEALKFATGTSRTDLAKAALDVSEQIGNIYTSRIAELQQDPSTRPFSTEVLTALTGAIGAPGTIAEAAGYTFPGEFARQQQRLASEIRGGLPATKVRIKGAPTYAKRRLSSWNREIKKAYSVAKANKNQFGIRGRIDIPKKAFPKIVKIVAAIRKGKKQKSKAGKQIKKALGYVLKRGKK